MTPTNQHWHLVYHHRIVSLLDALGATQSTEIERAGRVVANAWTNGGRLMIARTHHALHVEGTKRAGGPIAIEILEDRSDFNNATELLNLEAGDVVIIHSNSGTHGKAVGIALLARRAGAPTIALTQLPFELSDRVRPGHPSGQRLHEVADVVIDLGGDVGDAALAVPGSDVRVAPTSGVTGFVAYWMIIASACETMSANGDHILVLESQHFAGGAERNAERVATWRRTGLPFVRAGSEENG